MKQPALEPSAIALAAVIGALSAPGAQAQAQPWPSKPIRLVAPFAPGGGPDVLGRLMAPRLAEALGQPLVVENRPGAGGNLGAEFVVRAAPDGYTLLITTSAIAINASLYAKPAFSPTRDLLPVTLVATAPLVLAVHPSVPARSVQELLALARRAPKGGLNYGSSGTGTTTHLAGVMLASLGSAPLTHVPYKGSAPGLGAVLGGEVDFGFLGLFTAQPLLRAGKLRALAVTSARPSAALPDVPPIARTLPGYEMPIWYPMFAPALTPEAIVSRMQAETARALRQPEVRGAIERDGGEPVGSTPGELQALLARDLERFAQLVRISGAKPE